MRTLIPWLIGGGYLTLGTLAVVWNHAAHRKPSPRPQPGNVQASGRRDTVTADGNGGAGNLVLVVDEPGRRVAVRADRTEGWE